MDYSYSFKLQPALNQVQQCYLADWLATRRWHTNLLLRPWTAATPYRFLAAVPYGRNGSNIIDTPISGLSRQLMGLQRLDRLSNIPKSVRIAGLHSSSGAYWKLMSADVLHNLDIHDTHTTWAWLSVMCLEILVPWNVRVTGYIRPNAEPDVVYFVRGACIYATDTRGQLIGRRMASGAWAKLKLPQLPGTKHIFYGADADEDVN